jgi:hypothetical protein
VSGLTIRYPLASIGIVVNLFKGDHHCFGIVSTGACMCNFLSYGVFTHFLY